MSDEKKTAAAVDKAPAVQAVAYCGPTIKGVAPQYTVFVDGIPEKLAEIAEEHPRPAFRGFRPQKRCTAVQRP